MGINDAQAAINKGASAQLEHVVHYHSMKKSGDSRISEHTFGSFSEAKTNGKFEEYDIWQDDFMRKYTYKYI